MTTSFDFTMQKIDTDRLSCEIRSSSISAALDHIDILALELTVVFKTDLTMDEETTLLEVVVNHSGEPLPDNETKNVNVVNKVNASVSETAPFALPAYRTFWDNVDCDEGIEILAGETVVIDYFVPMNVYGYGGQIIVKDGVLGDQMVDACAYDIDGIVPEVSRSRFPNYPVLSKYVDKVYLPITGQISLYIMDTRPLIAGVISGLYLRMSYKAVNSGTARRVWINYTMLEKL